MSKHFDIKKVEEKKNVILNLKGRLDAYWAEHLSNYIDEIIREGHHHIVCNLKEVEYISSAGIRVFIKFFKNLKNINGSIHFSDISENVANVFEMVGLKKMFSKKSSDILPEVEEHLKLVEKNGTIYEYSLDNRIDPLKCNLIGDPEITIHQNITNQEISEIIFRKNEFGIGIGAFGENNDEIAQRAGEFIGFGEAVAYLPADGTNIPDYFVKSGNLVPRIKVLYSIIFEGLFGGTFFFRTTTGRKSISLSDLLKGILNITGYQQIGFVMFAETSGIVGVSLKKATEMHSGQSSLFEFPDIRENLHISTEPEFENRLTLTVGILSREPDERLINFVRPMGQQKDIWGHFHSAVFTYSPIKKSEKDSHITINHLFDQSKLIQIFHLLNDDREISGIGESEFKYGTCWIGEIK